MNAKKLLALLMAMMMALCSVSFAAIAEESETEAEVTPEPTQEPIPTVEPISGQYTYKTSVSTLPSGWNPHTYQTADDAVYFDYTTSGLYTLIFNDANHPIEGKDPFTGYVIVPEMAAEMPVDVTEEVKASSPQFNIPESATSGYAWKVKLREDLKWDDGTPIKAEDFVESFKRVLDPKLLNFRAADNYDGSYVVVNAKNYALAGVTNNTDNGILGAQLDEMTKDENGQYIYTGEVGASPVFIAVDAALDWCGGNSLKDYVDAYGTDYFGMDHWDELVALADDEGLVPCTDDNLALLSTVTTTVSAWGETDADLFNYLYIKETYPADYPYENVGLFASGEYELTYVYPVALDGFYLMTYAMPSSYLVKIDLYDACLKETETASGSVWSSTYGTSLETAVSYGPYKLTSFQSGKSMHFVKNENWFGYTDGNHTYVDPEDGETYDMYMTTDVDIQYVKESSTRKQMFLAGQLMSYSPQGTAEFDQYRNSEYFYVTPAETIFFLLFNGYESVINDREAAADFDQTTTDLQVQMLESFRRACAVSIDRDLMAATVSPQRSGGYAFVGSTYIYDPETAAYYRDTKQAKEALVDFYSINLDDYNGDLDAAVDAITGYDPETAKVKFQEAYEEALEKGYITDNDGDGKSDQTVTMVYAMSSEMNDFYEKTLEFLNTSLNTAAAGTGLEDKIAIVPSAPVGNAWSDNIRNGLMDTQLAGWSGSTLDPFGMADTWTRTDSAYWGAWYDASKYDMTLTIDGEEITMSVRDWAMCLNGTMKNVNGKDYNFGYGQTDVENRLTILAAIERHMLTSYNCVPIMQDGGGSLLSQQVFYVVEEYNPMMGRGGIAYMKYNYDDAEWAAFVAEQGGVLQY